MDALAWIEQTRFSVFVREDFYAYFVLLVLHAWGMAFLVGGGVAVSLRVLGVASAARLERFRGFLPVMWIGAAYLVWRIARDVLANGDPIPPRGRWMAAAALALWLGGVASGKLLLYTNTMLMTTD